MNETLKLILALSPFVVFIGLIILDFRNNIHGMSTNEIIQNDDGYLIRSNWGEIVLKKEEIKREEDHDWCDLEVLRTMFRSCRYFVKLSDYPPRNFRLVELKNGLLKYHLLPLKRIKDTRSNKTFE